LQSRRIKNKIVVLCEGVTPKIQGRESPQSYKAMEQIDMISYKTGNKVALRRILSQVL